MRAHQLTRQPSTSNTPSITTTTQKQRTRLPVGSKVWSGNKLFPANLAASEAASDPSRPIRRNQLIGEEMQQHDNNAAQLEKQAQRAATKAEALIQMAQHKQNYLDCFPKLEATRKLEIQEDIVALQLHAQALSHQAQELAVQAERRHLEEGLARSKLGCRR